MIMLVIIIVRIDEPVFHQFCSQIVLELLNINTYFYVHTYRKIWELKEPYKNDKNHTL